MEGFQAFGGAAMQRIEEIVTTSGQIDVDFTNIPQTYRHLRIVAQAKGASSGAAMFMTFNGDEGANYDWLTAIRYLTTNTSGTMLSAEGATRMEVGAYGIAGGALVVDIPGYVLRPGYAVAFAKSWGAASASIFGQYYDRAGQWRSSDPITRVRIEASSADRFAANCVFTLYGLL